ncbi:MAG: hypothetical protein CMJ89_04005, partial [Planctomycetes bacterium]|nr:hypothetical protein [Planctomycetota bacterium]
MGSIALAVLGATGCGLGTVGVASGAGGSGGGTTPALDFTVEDTKDSPATLHFNPSQAVQVSLFYDLGAGEGEQEMTGLTVLSGMAVVSDNRVALPQGSSSVSWDFGTQLGDTSFRPGVR